MKYTVLDIGTSKIGALEIEAKFKGFEILRFQEFRFPLDAKLPTAEVFVRQLKSVLENFSVHHSKLIVNMLPSDVATRFVELPFRDRKKIEQTLPFELADIVSFDVENTVTDHVVTESIGKKSNVLVCMTPRNKLISFLKIFEAHHVEPDIVQAPQVSLTSLLPYIPLPGDCFAIVDIGHSKTSVCIIDNGILKAVRVIAQGGFHLTKILSQIYEASLEESESIKLEKGYLICEKQERFNEDQTIFSDTLKKGLAPLIRDLNQTFVSMSSHNKKPIRNIYLTGGGSQLNNLPTYLTMELQIKTQLLEISSQKLPRPQSGLATTEEEINTKVLPILALALQHIFQVLPINFKKGALSRGQATVELFKYAKPITQVALAVILITSLHFFGKLYLHQSFHKKIDRNISSIITQYHPKAAEKYLNDPLKTKNFLKAEMKKAETLIGLAGGDPNSRIHPLHAIAKLTIVIRRHPQHDFIIDKIQFAQNQVKIEGSCKSEFAANALNSGLLEQPYVNMGSGYQDFPKFSQASSKPNVAPQTGAQGRVRFVFEYSLGVS